MKDALFIALQRLTPHHLLSRGIGSLAASEVPWIKNTFIKRFAETYDVNMSEAVDENPLHYPSFNAFFTRALKPGARPVDADKNSLVSPADGVISQLGQIENGRMLQAKGHHFSVADLLADKASAERYQGGHFATVYLSPKDYHRVHMPFAGTLAQMTHVPGRLFSVNQSTTEQLPRLFARNERVVCHFDTPFGPAVVVMVGAMIVASIETAWAGIVTPHKRQVRHKHYGKEAPVTLAKGDEMGKFLLGSTAIVLTPPGAVRWNENLTAGSEVKLGQALGYWQHSTTD